MTNYEVSSIRPANEDIHFLLRMLSVGVGEAAAASFFGRGAAGR